MSKTSNNTEFELIPDGYIPDHIRRNHSLYSKVPQVQVQTLAPLDGEGSPSLPSSSFFSSSDFQSQSDKLHKAWSEFLMTQDWQWFVTFTFKEEIHPEAADKLYRVWLNKLNRALYGQRWRKKQSGGVKWVRALEWQKRGVLHYHALISNVGYADRDTWAACWTELGETSKAGFIKIDQYDESQGGAEAYLSNKRRSSRYFAELSSK